jgi:hypothetical protein
MNLADLRKPFPPERISWRIGSTNADKSKGMALAYIDARDVMSRLDEVCGMDGWQNRYIPMHDKKTVCEIGVRINSDWIWKSDGAGDSDVEAEKGALSDAFKRAAVRWGIGQYLYDLDSPWVEIEAAGRSFKIKSDQYAKLKACLTPKSDEPGELTLLKNWVQQQKSVISECKTLPELTDWLDRNGGDLLRPALTSSLDRLMKKSNPSFIDIKNHYLARMNKL